MIEFGGILSLFKGKEPPPSTPEVIGGVEITRNQYYDKVNPTPTAFRVEIPTVGRSKTVRRIHVGEDVKLPLIERDTVEVIVSGQPSYPQLTALGDTDKFNIIELRLKHIKEISPSYGEWVVDAISGKGNPRMTELALSPNDKKIRFSSYGFNNNFTELKSKIGPRVIFDPIGCSEPSKLRQLFPNPATKASA